MRYQGGKYRIAKNIVAKIRETHPTATEIWEPFCGGGAVTLALAKAGFKVHASDNHEDLILMWQALMHGETEPFADVTETEHAALKTAAPSARRGFVGFGASFGGAFFSGFARQGTAGRGYLCDSARIRDGKFQAWHEAIRSMSKLREFQITFERRDYRTVPDDVLVYADPPYEGTAGYSGGSFDHIAFWSWVRAREGPTFVSELRGPDDIDIVWRKQHKSQNASNAPGGTKQPLEREERLYYFPGEAPLAGGYYDQEDVLCSKVPGDLPSNPWRIPPGTSSSGSATGSLRLHSERGPFRRTEEPSTAGTIHPPRRKRTFRSAAC